MHAGLMYLSVLCSEYNTFLQVDMSLATLRSHTNKQVGIAFLNPELSLSFYLKQ